MSMPNNKSLLSSFLLTNEVENPDKYKHFDRVAEITVWVAVLLTVLNTLTPFGEALRNTTSYLALASVGVFSLIWFRLLARKISDRTKNLLYTIFINIILGLVVFFTDGIQSYAIFFFYISTVIISMSTPFKHTLIGVSLIIAIIIAQGFFTDGVLTTNLSLATLHIWGILLTALYGRLNASQAVMVRTHHNEVTLEKEKSLSRLKDEFIYIISHELKKPAQSIEETIKKITSEYSTSLSTDGKDLLRLTGVNNSRLNKLLNDLQDLSRIEKGSLPVQLGDVSLRPIIGEVISTLVLDAKEKRIALIQRGVEEVAATADVDRLKEILTNLIGNAIKYTSEGGKVMVEASKEGKFARVTVSDNGFGISEEDQKHLFEKFYRVESEKTKTVKGSGLGLFITKQLVEKMGGQLSFKSKLGQGTTFYFTLPRYRW